MLRAEEQMIGTREYYEGKGVNMTYAPDMAEALTPLDELSNDIKALIEENAGLRRHIKEMEARQAAQGEQDTKRMHNLMDMIRSSRKVAFP